MVRNLKYFHLMMVAPVLILYVNCDGYKSASIDVSSQSCTNSASLSLKLLNFDPKKDCQQSEQVICEHRSFRPDLENKIYKTFQCSENKFFGEICMELTHLDFDTSEASDDEALYQSGASYNYEEYNCYYQGFFHQKKPIFSSTGNTLNESLTKLYLSCQEAG